MDHLITELELAPVGVYYHLARLIEQVNAVVAVMGNESEWRTTCCGEKNANVDFHADLDDFMKGRLLRPRERQ